MKIAIPKYTIYPKKKDSWTPAGQRPKKQTTLKAHSSVYIVLEGSEMENDPHEGKTSVLIAENDNSAFRVNKDLLKIVDVDMADSYNFERRE